MVGDIIKNTPTSSSTTLFSSHFHHLIRSLNLILFPYHYRESNQIYLSQVYNYSEYSSLSSLLALGTPHIPITTPSSNLGEGEIIVHNHWHYMIMQLSRQPKTWKRKGSKRLMIKYWYSSISSRSIIFFWDISSYL